MKYSRTVTLKDGRACLIRSGAGEDAQANLDNYILTHAQTEFLTTYPDEIALTVEKEREYLQKKEESPRDAALLAEVGGEIAGSAGVDALSGYQKLRHRAHFGISIDRKWWGLGIGRALTQACVECAKAAGFTQLELEVVADNARAISLYKSAGFVEYGRNPFGFRTRDGVWQEIILMRLELAE